MSVVKSLTIDTYSPKPGDIIWTDFDPRVGREQSGRRPAVVVSVQELYDASRFVIVCPITKTVRPFGFSVVLQGNLSISGEILTSQLRSIDTMARPFTYAGASLSDWQMEDLREKLAGLLGIE